MPRYRVELNTGQVLEVTAQRMVVEAALTTFANHHSGAWLAELEIPSGQVESVDRRCTEFNGSWRWLRLLPAEVVDPDRVRSPIGSFLSR